jgi:hypothetical protein
MEADRRNKTYYRLLCELNEDDFIEACDRILFSDEWFPTIARIRAVAAECANDRHRTRQAVTVAPPLVCPYCHGARWVRAGGYDPPQMQAGNEGSRVQPCPRCTSAGAYDAYQEQHVIANEGGVPNEAAPRDVDMSRTTWSVPRTPEGRVDVEALYRQSRVLRGLDPNVDDRPRGVGEWKTLGDVMTAPEPKRELVAVGADDWSVDDVPFD